MSEELKKDWRQIAHKIRETIDDEIPGGPNDGIGEEKVAETLEGFEEAESQPGQLDALFLPPETADDEEPNFGELPPDPFFLPPTPTDDPKKK